MFLFKVESGRLGSSGEPSYNFPLSCLTVFFWMVLVWTQPRHILRTDPEERAVPLSGPVLGSIGRTFCGTVEQWGLVGSERKTHFTWKMSLKLSKKCFVCTSEEPAGVL